MSEIFSHLALDVQSCLLWQSIKDDGEEGGRAFTEPQRKGERRVGKSYSSSRQPRSGGRYLTLLLVFSDSTYASLAPTRTRARTCRPTAQESSARRLPDGSTDRLVKSCCSYARADPWLVSSAARCSTCFHPHNPLRARTAVYISP